jgi:teichuronic acid biosynthesis protein TuaE
MVYRAISVVICVEMLIAILEVMGYFRYPISPYSSLSPLFGKVGGVDWLLDDEILADMLRTPTGFSWNPNQLGAKIVIILPFILLLNSKLYRYIGVAIALAIILLSGSRGSVIAAFIVLSAYAVLYLKKDLRLWLKFIAALTFTIYMGWNYFVVDTYFALAAYMSTDDLDLAKLDSIGVRQVLIKNAMDTLWNTYGLGVGGGADIAMQLMFDNTYWGGRSDEHTLSMHNFWIELLINGGVGFFLIFVVWYSRITYLLYMISQSSTDKRLTYYSSASCLSLIGFSFAAISASSVIYFLPMWLLFGFSIATLNIHYSLKSKVGGSIRTPYFAHSTYK